MGLQLKLVPWHLCHLWRWTLHHFWWEEIQLWWWLWIHPNRGVFKCSCDVNLQGSFRKESQWHQLVFSHAVVKHILKKKTFWFTNSCCLQNSCGHGSANGTFRVITENVPCGTTGTTCSKAIKIFLGVRIHWMIHTVHDCIVNGCSMQSRSLMNILSFSRVTSWYWQTEVTKLSRGMQEKRCPSRSAPWGSTLWLKLKMVWFSCGTEKQVCSSSLVQSSRWGFLLYLWIVYRMNNENEWMSNAEKEWFSLIT